MTRAAGRPGRKARPANQGQRASLGLKVTPAIKNKLDAAAKANGRTQSQEAEVRIEYSFDREDLIWEVMRLKYGIPLAGLLMTIGKAVEGAGRAATLYSQFAEEDRRYWANDPFAYNEALKAANHILDRLRPHGEIVVPSGFGPKVQNIGIAVAEDVLAQLPSEVPISPEHNPYHAETAQFRRALGAEVTDRARVKG